MDKDNFVTNVTFFKEENGTVMAILGNKHRNGLLTCYSHIGQHSEASESYIKECTPIPADKVEEFKDLFTELESLGYDLRVKNNIRF